LGVGLVVAAVIWGYEASGAGGEAAEVRGRTDACDHGRVEERLAALFDAISRGEPDIAGRFFAHGRDAPFQWFSFTQLHRDTPNHFVTYSRDSLEARFAHHFAAGDRFVLQGVQINDMRAGALHFGPAHFLFHDGTDRGPARRGAGKGAYHCDTESFIVLSIGTGG
jgi:hypothetical protein